MCELNLPETNIDNIENGPFEYVFHGISYWNFFFQPAKGDGWDGPPGVRKSTSSEGINWFGSGERVDGGVWVSSSLVFFIRSWHIWSGDPLILEQLLWVDRGIWRMWAPLNV